MSVPRRFDYDSAKRRYQQGERVVDLAAEFGVSEMAVYRAINDQLRQRMDAAATRLAVSASCVDCGANCSRYRTGVGVNPEPRCRVCASRHSATTVRERELRCVTCKEWKADEAFPKGKASPLRRGRHGTCRACHTKIKRAYRDARKQPCSHGCGTLVDTVDRRNKDKPLECRSCAMRRVHQERKVAA